MKKKLLVALLVTISAFTLTLGFSACDLFGNESHTHNYASRIVSPTCTEEGYTIYECSCGESYREDVVEALGHDMLHQQAQEATCSHVGTSEHDYCSRCDYHTEYTIQR